MAGGKIFSLLTISFQSRHKEHKEFLPFFVLFVSLWFYSLPQAKSTPEKLFLPQYQISAVILQDVYTAQYRRCSGILLSIRDRREKNNAKVHTLSEGLRISVFHQSKFYAVK
jgi:hypothetical protein